jgi:hypothetical protein
MAVCGAERGRLRYIYCGQVKSPGSAQDGQEEQHHHGPADNQAKDRQLPVAVADDTEQAQDEPQRRRRE